MKKVLNVLFVFASILIICRFSIAISERPDFIELPIAPPMGYLGDDEWDVTIKTIHQYTRTGGGEGKYFLLRKEKAINVAEMGGETVLSIIDTKEEIISYFDDWLTRNGWEHHKNERCVYVLPEDQFISLEEDGYLVYVPRDEDPFPIHPQVCLVVWEVSNLDSRVYHVVLVSVNPSPLTISDW